MRIIEHGAAWAFRVQELRKRGHLPNRVLFAVDGPDLEKRDQRVDAFKEARDRLRDTGVDITAADDREGVLEFAAG